MGEPARTRTVLRPWQRRIVRALLVGAVLLSGTGVFLIFSEGATEATAVSLVVHVLASALLVPVLLAFVLPHMVAQRLRRPSIRATGYALLLICLAVIVSGAWPLFEGVSTAVGRLTHTLLGAGLLLFYAVHRRRGVNPLSLPRYGAALLAVALMGLALHGWERANPDGGEVTAADGELAFAPSSSRLRGTAMLGDIEVIDDSSACVECHKVITDEWERSAHRHASMTNPFYRGTIQAMRKKYPLEATKWCAGCHDPALLFTDRMAQEDLDFTSRAAQVGLSCVACHAVDVRGHAGNADYTFRSRRVYAWERSEDPRIREAHSVLLRLKPEAHIASLTPSNIRSSTFCATCHKAEIPPELNQWHWLRAVDEYDAWHSSGVSMNNARAFYHPDGAKRCQDCHMPKVQDRADPAADGNGMVRSHIFAVANTGLPFLRGDKNMIERQRAFIRTAARIDITALDVTSDGKADERYFPLQAARPGLEAGTIVEAHVVVRTVGIGHRFPGGTIDSNEVWVEFEAALGEEEPFYRSGTIDPDSGLVDPSSEFYRAYLADREGRRVVNRIGPDVYTRVYAKTIPPGAADVVRYRFRVPAGAKGPLKLRARLRYRKFMREYLDFLFEDPSKVPYPDGEGTERLVDLTKLPILEIAQTTVELALGTSKRVTDVTAWDDGWAERLQDLGIGYLLQKDFVRAQAAFEHLVEVSPASPDAWVNLARVRFQQRNYPATRDALIHALTLSPGLPKALFLQGEVQRAASRFKHAEASYRAVLQSFPEDRMALLQLGLVLWEQDRATQALWVIQQLLEIDEANPQAWFLAINCYKQLGDAEGLTGAEKKLRFYRPDDDEWSRTGAARLEDSNLERLSRLIHIHRQPGVEKIR